LEDNQVIIKKRDVKGCFIWFLNIFIVFPVNFKEHPVVFPFQASLIIPLSTHHFPARIEVTLIRCGNCQQSNTQFAGHMQVAFIKGPSSRVPFYHARLGNLPHNITEGGGAWAGILCVCSGAKIMEIAPCKWATSQSLTSLGTRSVCLTM